jgi:hypothetical protein
MGHRPSKQCLEIVELCISEDGSTRKEIEKLSGYSRTVVGYATDMLMEQHRIFISEWPNARYAVFCVGNHPSAKKPPVMTDAQRQKKYKKENAARLKVMRRAKEHMYSKAGHWAALMPAPRAPIRRQELIK